MRDAVGVDAAPDPSAVLAAFGLPGAVAAYVEVAGGWSNRVLRLSTSRGGYAVKAIRNPWGVPTWRRWLDESWRLELAALSAGVAMPSPVPASDGGCIALVDTTAGDARVPVRVHRWVDGHRPDAADVAVARWAGRTLAQVHALALQPRDPLLFPLPSTASADAWPELVTKAREARVPWAGDLARTQAAVVRSADLLRPVGERPMVMSHGDLRPTNVLVTSSGPLLCDWDVAMPRVPGWDLTGVAVAFADWRESQSARSVLSGYAEAGGEVGTAVPEHLGPTLAARLDFVSLCIHRALGLRPATPRERADAHAVLPDVLRRLPAQVELAESIRDWLAAGSAQPG